MKFKVFLSKAYFPKDVWSVGYSVESVAGWVVRAESRTDAAKKVWERYRRKWRPLMLPHIKHVSLHVNDPMAGTSGIAGRLEPIRVE